MPLVTTVLVGIIALLLGGVLGGAGFMVFGGTSDSLEDADSKAAKSLMMAAGDMDSEYEELRESVSTVVPEVLKPEQEGQFSLDDAVAACEDI